jgi:predicted RNA-binding protein with PUA domain
MPRKDAITLTYNGETKTIKEWCEALNLPLHSVRCRIHVGWNAEQALTTPFTGRTQIKIPRYIKPKNHGR